MNISQLAEADTKALKDKCNTLVSDVLKKKIPPSIESLLALDSTTQMKMVCVTLATKISKERVKQWIVTHVTVSLFTKEYENEMQKVVNCEPLKKVKALFSLPPGGRGNKHDNTCLSAFHLLEQIKVIFQ